MTWFSTALIHQMPLLGDTYDWMSAWPTGWPNVKMTYIVLFLATRCLYGRATSDWMSAWPKGWTNVKMTWLSTIHGHEMPLPRRWHVWLNVSLDPSRITKCLRWPDVVLFSAIRCLYLEGYIWLNVSLTQRDDQMSRWLYIVLFLAIRCLYGRLHLIECQLDQKDNQMSRWPDLVLLSLAIRCLSLEDTYDWMSAWPTGWPNVKMTLHCSILGHQMPLLGGYIWLNVSLTQRMNKCQNDLT